MEPACWLREWNVQNKRRPIHRKRKVQMHWSIRREPLRSEATLQPLHISSRKTQRNKKNTLETLTSF